MSQAVDKLGGIDASLFCALAFLLGTGLTVWWLSRVIRRK